MPITAAFHPAQPSLLTVVWSDNSLQHIPLVYTSRESSNAARQQQHNASLNATATLNTTLAFAGLVNNASNNLINSPALHFRGLGQDNFHGLNGSAAMHNVTTIGYGALGVNSPSTSRACDVDNLSLLGDSICSPIRNDLQSSLLFNM